MEGRIGERSSRIVIGGEASLISMSAEQGDEIYFHIFDIFFHRAFSAGYPSPSNPRSKHAARELQMFIAPSGL